MRTRIVIPFVFSVVGMFSQMSYASEQSQDKKNRYLLQAAEGGSTNAFRDAVKLGASLQATNDEGLPAIALAIKKDKLKFLQWLLSEDLGNNTNTVPVEIPDNTPIQNEVTPSPRTKMHRKNSFTNLKGRMGSKEKIKEPEVQEVQEVLPEPQKVRVKREPVYIPKAYNLSKTVREDLLQVRVSGYGNYLHIAAEFADEMNTGSTEMLEFFYNTLPEEIRFEYLTEQNEKGETPLMVAERAHKIKNWFWIAKTYFEYGQANVNKFDMDKPRHQCFSEELEKLRFRLGSNK